VSGRPRNPTDKLLQRLTQTPEGRQKIREAVKNMKTRAVRGAAMSGKTGGPLPGPHYAPTVHHLPGCPNGCGEMLALDDGWQCPVCNWYRGYYKGERHP
jgi:hypothetical protein